MNILLFFLSLFLISPSYAASSQLLKKQLLEDMNNPKKYIIELKNNQNYGKFFNTYSRSCELAGASTVTGKKEKGVFKKIWNSILGEKSRLIKKIDNGIVSWQLKAADSSSGSCDENAEFMIDKNGNFLVPQFKKLKTTLSLYARYSCRIEENKKLSKARNLTKEEAQAIVRCFYDRSKFWDYAEKYGVRAYNDGISSQIVGGTGTGMAAYCGRYLFEKAQPSRKLNCNQKFMKLGMLAPEITIGKVDGRDVCTHTFTKKDYTFAKVLCPVGTQAAISIYSGQTAFFTKGNCEGNKVDFGSTERECKFVSRNNVTKGWSNSTDARQSQGKKRRTVR